MSGPPRSSLRGFFGVLLDFLPLTVAPFGKRRGTTMQVTGEFWRMPRVLAECGFTKSTLYKLMREKRFPTCCKVGRASVWLQADIEGWKRAIANGAEWVPNGRV